METTIKGIIFDLGCTLMYFDSDWYEVEQAGAADMAAFFAHKRIQLDEAALVEAFLEKRRTGYERSMQSGLEATCGQSLVAALETIGAPSQAFDVVPEAVRVNFTREEATWRAYPESKATLKYLAQQGYRLGLLSNATDDAFVQRLVNKLEFRPYLSPTFSSAGLINRKPRREAFDRFTTTWNLPARQIVMVGDRLDADVLGARNSGMLSVLMTVDEPDSNHDLRESVVPDATIHTIGELPALIENWPARTAT